MAGLLNKKDRDYLTEEFKKIAYPVRLAVFTQKFECEYCEETRTIVEEIAGLSDKIKVDVYDFEADAAKAQEYGVDKLPAIVLLQDGNPPKHFGIRYYGVPAGYEFSSLVHDILMVGSGDSGLSPQAKAWAASVTSPVHFQVFVTPTCPYCPQAVVMAHRLAMENPLIHADMVEVQEFPHMAVKYQVMGVPRTVVNETIHIEGAVPEATLIKRIEAALQTA